VQLQQAKQQHLAAGHTIGDAADDAPQIDGLMQRMAYATQSTLPSRSTTMTSPASG
jgi:hypothetical protein